MKQWLKKILGSLAILLVLGHNVFPHHHHDEEIAIAEHHDHDDNDHHSLFAFGQMDEIFLPGKMQCIFHCYYTPFIFKVAGNELNLELTLFYKKPEYSFCKEFPPPGSYLHPSSLRGPPFA